MSDKPILIDTKQPSVLKIVYPESYYVLYKGVYYWVFSLPKTSKINKQNCFAFFDFYWLKYQEAKSDTDKVLFLFDKTFYYKHRMDCRNV